MAGEQMVLQYLFFVTTLAFIMLFDFVAKKKLGIQSQGYLNLRLPKFISLLIIAIAAIVVLVLLKCGGLITVPGNFLAVPYFAAIAYFLTAFFREIKTSPKQ